MKTQIIDIEARVKTAFLKFPEEEVILTTPDGSLFLRLSEASYQCEQYNYLMSQIQIWVKEYGAGSDFIARPYSISEFYKI